MKAFGIFEGGGVKGLAHVGAVAAAASRDIEFEGLAGTSAGAIVAALLSVGYSPQDLFDPAAAAGDRGLLDIAYTRFFDPKTWADLKSLERDFRKRFASSDAGQISALRAFGTWMQIADFTFRHRAIVKSLVLERGIFGSEEFARWFEPLLKAGVCRQRPDLLPEFVDEARRVTFGDIDLPLKIIATDLTNRSIRVFSKTDPRDKNRSVAEAVVSSISIPLFFKPTLLKEQDTELELVDGGLLSNFPAWVFDDERYSLDGKQDQIHTFGFKFAADPPAPNSSSSPGGFLRYLGNLATTALSGGEDLQSREIKNLHIVPLKVRTGTLQLDLEDDDRIDLYERGRNCTRDYFDSFIGPKNAEIIEAFLAVCANHIKADIGHRAHLRLYIMQTVGRYNENLKVLYTHNFDSADTDDRMELPIEGCPAGRCWTTQTPVFVDMDKVRANRAAFIEEDAVMLGDKYHVKMIRPTLRAMLFVPIFNRTSRRMNGQPPLLGVLGIDTDDDLRDAFSGERGNDRVLIAARQVAQLASDQLA